MRWCAVEISIHKDVIRPPQRTGSDKRLNSLSTLSSVLLDDVPSEQRAVNLALAAHQIVQVLDKYFIFGGEGTAFMQTKASLHSYSSAIVALVPRSPVTLCFFF